MGLDRRVRRRVGRMLPVGFEKLIALDVILYGLSLASCNLHLCVPAFYEPDLPRPFRVPGGKWGVAVVGVAPVLLAAHSPVPRGFWSRALVSSRRHRRHRRASWGRCFTFSPVRQTHVAEGAAPHGPLTPTLIPGERNEPHFTLFGATPSSSIVLVDADGCLGQLDGTASGFGARDAPFEHDDASVFRLDLEPCVDQRLSQYSRA